MYNLLIFLYSRSIDFILECVNEFEARLYDSLLREPGFACAPPGRGSRHKGEQALLYDSLLREKYLLFII